MLIPNSVLVVVILCLPLTSPIYHCSCVISHSLCNKRFRTRSSRKLTLETLATQDNIFSFPSTRACLLDGSNKHLSDSRSFKTFYLVEITFDIEWQNIGRGPGF